jgi:hypothetical protein
MSPSALRDNMKDPADRTGVENLQPRHLLPHPDSR